MKPVCVDFETEAIENRPKYPPKPVGVSIKWPGSRPEYWAWGHPSGNNCIKSEAKLELKSVWRHKGGVVFHNAAFDMAVALKYFSLRWLYWHEFDDVMLLAFLDDPYRKKIGLKELANDLLEMEAEEQNYLKTWILANVSEMRGRKKDWARFICRAPGNVVGRYANGDTLRTIRLFDHYKWVRDSMPEAYERERRLLRVLEDMSTDGIPIDPNVHKIAEELPKQRVRLDSWIRRELGRPPSFDLQKREELCDAIESAGFLDEWIETPKGGRSLAHEDFKAVCKHTKFAEALHQRGLMATIDQTFISRWSEAAKIDGRLHVNWNSTRAESVEGRQIGARTGRLSSSPNVQNISKEGPPVSVVPNLTIPNLRTLVAVVMGFQLAVADYSQQEPRMAANFAGGTLAKAYRVNPKLDFHSATTLMMAQVGKQVTRDTAKTLGLAILYTLGLDGLSFRLGISREEASILRKLFRKAQPDIAKLEKDLKDTWGRDESITTWGGRYVWMDEPFHGRSFAYRALNYLCQGSSADQTKQAMIDYHDDDTREGNLILSVHDELITEAPTKAIKREAKLLATHMEAVSPFNVPFRADVGIGRTWWGAKPKP